MCAAQSDAPVLSNIDAGHPALQSNQPIHVAGGIYSSGQVAYGAVGTPLLLTGSDFGQGGWVWFIPYKNGVRDTNASAVPAPVSLWSETAITATVPANALTGTIQVIADGVRSNQLPFVVIQGTYSGACQSGQGMNPVQITTNTLPDGAVSHSYSQSLQATGGSHSYTWSLASGSLPQGLSLSSSGVISGTPSSSGGNATFMVQVADTSTPPQYDATTLSMAVAAQAEGASSASLYSFSIQATGGGSGYDPAGNVIAYTDSVNGTWSFSYDTLNRLATASGTQADNPYPNLCWQYDGFGNRLWQTSSSSAYPNTDGGPNACPVSSGPSVGASYNASNQMNDGLHQYDAAGDLTADSTNGNSYLYDAEGRICAVEESAVGGISIMTQYLYDAEGRRVAKGAISTFSCDTASNGFSPTTIYVLGPGGEQLTELTNTSGTQTPTWQVAHTNVYAAGQQIATYDADLTGATEGALYFHLSDWLGTRRQQTDYAGNPVLNFTGLPYGDGMSVVPVTGTDVADATEHHFSGKERDQESGNDYFGARYFASSMGRMLSPDPLGGSLANPQSMNKYAYALNNPLVNTDPTGMYVCSDSQDHTKCDTDNDKKFAQSLSDARNAAFQHLSGFDLLNAINAVNAYGEAGKDNGVSVGFDSNLSDSNGNPVAGEVQVSGLANGTKSDLNPNGQNIRATFNPDKLSGAGGAGNVAHEGSHIADGEAWVASGFAFASNPTRMTTELKAYHVGSDVALGVMASDPRWDGTGLLPSIGYWGRNSSASRFLGESWSNVQDMFRDLIKNNYANVGSPAFSSTIVVPK